MRLANYLTLRTPILWVVTDEPARCIDDMIAAPKARRIFRMDAIDGLMSYNTTRQMWEVVLVQIDAETMSPTWDMSVAMGKAIEERGVLVIDYAHTKADKLFELTGSLLHRYRTGFWADDNDKIPAQLVLMSHEPTPPKELARVTTLVTHELPTAEQLEGLVDHITESLEIEVATEQIVRAGRGLSEQEFITASLDSLRASGDLRPGDVNDFKLSLLKDNGILEVREPGLTMADLGGLDNARALVDAITWLWSNPEEARRFQVEPTNRILLVGVPGSGKSLLCEVIASALGLELAKGGISASMSKYVGESEANMRRMFATLKRMAPIVFWQDEFGRDMSGGQSSASVDGGTTDRVHGEFLTGIQELPKDIFLVAAANRINDLAPEMLRADRFDKIMFVGFPTFSERCEIFRIHLGESHVEHDIEDLARATPLFTGAEIKGLIKDVRFAVVTTQGRPPTSAEIISHIPNVKNRIWVNHQDAIMEMYTRAMTEWEWASSTQQIEAQFVEASAKNRTVHRYLVDGTPDAVLLPSQTPQQGAKIKNWG